MMTRIAKCGYVFKICDEPELANEGACLRHMMNRTAGNSRANML